MPVKENHHPRDDNIQFFEKLGDKTHVYVIKGMVGHPSSMTQTLHHFFTEFIKMEVVNKMMKSKNWSESEYYGLTPEQIIQKWDEASELGTQMHFFIELFFKWLLKVEPDTEEFKMFKKLWADFQHKFPEEFKMFKNFWADFQRKFPDIKPYRFEWLVYDEDKKIAGSIDWVGIDSEGNLWLIDWKRCKNIRTENKWQKGKGPFSHLDDCNFVHYTLQLNGYRYILMNKYGFNVKGMFLAVFHPNQKGQYKFLQVPDRYKEIDDMWKLLPLQLEPEKSEVEVQVENPELKYIDVSKSLISHQVQIELQIN